VHLGPGGRQRRRSPIRTGEADDLMPGIEEFADDGGPDESVAPVTNTRMVHSLDTAIEDRHVRHQVVPGR
jgi:hypothetical protein